ncbi:LOW QUALITY PROTEIN: WD repeat-containing protein 55-like [Mercenaria mercenaria]|uniref:LOW QUALITY PROTEIN: WD repeat-containing protein 55-like n=1 Tax=Mercenaria mercenaria TaxID=6596 RepID=UPI00234E9DC5|nr:LOW QUALITY PROTEIN: WD repeat-containing protein 55-like [Mercenaria mercenaria]
MATDMIRKPKDISFSDIVVDICFHPEKDVIASGTIEGDAYLHSYSTTSENSELMKLSHHKKSCRVVRFSPSGEELHTASKDKSFNSIDLNTGTVKRKVKSAHESPIYSMLVTGENFLVTGDDDGHLKLWDLRQQKAVMEVKESEEFISDIAVDDAKRTLLTTSGEGTLTAFNLRRKKLDTQSELFDSEFLSLAIVKRGQKVVCGCGMGELNIFTWGEWGNISDRFPGHPMSVDCMVPLTDDIVCTGSCDGMIRAVNILPNRFLGVVGEHPGDFPVENLSLSRDKHWLASCSHDQKIKFWNVDSIKDETVDVKSRAKKGNKSKFLKSSDKGDFFADMAADENNASTSGQGEGDDDDDSDEMDDSDDEDD